MTRLLLALSIFALACDPPAPETASPVSQEATQTVVAPPKAEEPAAPAATPKFGESDVMTLVNAWVAAQNESDFEAYSALYAPKFEGIKRVGPKKSSYNRETWLKDRHRMFAKKVEVSAADIEITVAGRSAIAQFTQTWSSGSFRDVGPKQLVMVLEGDELKIAREEMLASTIVGHDANAPAVFDPRQFTLMLGPKWVLLSTDTEGISVGTPRVVSRDGEAIAPVKKAAAALQAFVGTTFVAEGGSPCTAKVKALQVLARATPHFGQISYWNGEEPGHPKLADGAVAKEIWDLASRGGHVLVGELDKPCVGASWAHVPDSKPVVLAAGPSKKLKDVATSRFRSLPGYKGIQKEFAEMEGSKKPWDSAGSITVKEFGDAFVSVTAVAGAGCGEFQGEFWALFEVAKTGDLVLLTDPKSPGDFVDPLGAARIGTDVVFFAADVIVQKQNGAWRRTADATIPYFDCPC